MPQIISPPRIRLRSSSASERFLVGIAVAVCLWTVFRHWGYLVDDTFIALRYARNLVEGHGLVFNPGERVEGYTSLGWVLLGAGFLALGVEPEAWLAGVSAVAGAGVLWLVTRIERGLVAPGSAPARVPVSALLLLATPAFAYWAFRAMDTMLFTALLLFALVLAMREVRKGRWRGSGVVFALLCLVRPEAFSLFLLAGGSFALAERARNGSWRHLRRHAGNACLVAGAAGAYLAWRVAYYGELLPNTFYAKVTGGPGQLATGLGYLGHGALAFPLLAAALLFPLLLARTRSRSRVREPELALGLYAVLVGYVGYVVAVGADFMPFFRFFVPALPIAAVLSALALRALPLPERAAGPALAALVALHAAAGLATEQPYRAFVAHRTALVGKRVGEWLGSRFAPDDWIAVNTAGAVPYFSRLPAIDMLGLTDAQIARRPIYIISEGWAGHRRGWGEYVLRRRPSAILWYNSAGLAEPHYLSDHELADDPLFRFFYALRVDALPPEPGSGPGAPIRRFLGYPFGTSPTGESAIPDLGLRLELRDGLVPWTTFREGPIQLSRFELDRRDLDLWEEAMRLRGDLARFVDAAAARFAEDAASDGADPEARREVEALCLEARIALEEGDVERAKSILAAAAARNGAARSPLLPHYVANVAVESGELFAAVAAQKEALRLDPGSRLHRENLVRLLSVPYAVFRRRPRHSRSRRSKTDLRRQRGALP